MSENLQTLDVFRRVNSTFPYSDPVREWKESGKKVIGYSCLYVPEEIFYAAGLLPLRAYGSCGTYGLEDANAYMYPNSCSFVRTTFQLALEEQYGFLDGFIGSTMCDMQRRLYDNWDKYVPTPFTHCLDPRRKTSQRDIEFYTERIREMMVRLEQHFQTQITDGSLREAMRLYNATRNLLARLYEFRKVAVPPISGAETMEVMNAGMRMPKEQFNKALLCLLDELSSTDRQVRPGYRLMFTGSPMNNPEFIAGFEAAGGMVVIDDLCFGTRYWSDPVDETIVDPVVALATRYQTKYPCATMTPGTVRIERTVALAREYKVDGVISQVIRCCEPYGWREMQVRERLDEVGIPVLSLDLEFGSGFSGQIATRLQAFLEMIEQGGVVSAAR